MKTNNNGFTLLEILMAISIFAIVIGLAYSSYNASFRIIGGATSQSEIYSQAQTAMERIREDLESFYPGETSLFTGTSDTINGHRADSLEFTSTASVKFHPWQVNSGHSIISYQVEEDSETKTLSIYRSQQAVTTGEDDEEKTEKTSALLLSDTLLEVAFDYQDGEGTEKETWADSDEDKEAGDEDGDAAELLPKLIRLTLRFANGNDDELGILFQTAIVLPAAKTD